MRDEDMKTIHSIYKKFDAAIPHNKINSLVMNAHTIIESISIECCRYKNVPHTDLTVSNFIRSFDMKQSEVYNWEVEYKNGLSQVQKVHKLMKQRTYDTMCNKKKIVYLVVAYLRKSFYRPVNNKGKRICREMSGYYKKSDKDRREYIKRTEKAEIEKKKHIEENKEASRQKRKFEYLLSQTELFSQFMLGKKDVKFATAEETDVDIAAINKKFQSAASDVIEDGGVAKNDSKAVIDDKVQLKQPSMLNCVLKNYQITGFNWLAKLYNQGINGILADDMGLGKTVQSIALLAYLAETEDICGPFLVVTPVSTLHNWEQELKKFVPNFKVLNYWGNANHRSQAKTKIKKANVVLTSYQIAVSDFKIFKKHTWKYMILDEAQAIKSSSSKRWTTLLSFKTKSRLLLTGTPVQNTMSELWALLHFIMPSLFDSLSEFSEWFSKGIEDSAERKKAVDEIQLQKLHAILKPFMLRRLKSDVKTELGEKKEIEVYCDLSIRQKIYYQSIIDACKSYEMENVMMQLRKVCNHPDIFEKLCTTTRLSLLKNEKDGRSIVLGRSKMSYKIPSLISDHIRERVDTQSIWNKLVCKSLRRIRIANQYVHKANDTRITSLDLKCELVNDNCIFLKSFDDITRCMKHKQRLSIDSNMLEHKLHKKISNVKYNLNQIPVITKNIVSSLPYVYTNNGPYLSVKKHDIRFTIENIVFIPPLDTFIIDSGKLLLLDKLLTKLKQEDHRCLLYFQMTKMMDLVEDYLVKKEYSYCRLDGSSKIAYRRDTVNDWQTGDKFIFLLSTRAGGLGINLTAADTVIFYDSDWNPTVDQQAMDRAYRIGQTKDVTVYRLITNNTIEERVMEKATNKGNLQKMVIKGKIFEGLDF